MNWTKAFHRARAGGLALTCLLTAIVNQATTAQAAIMGPLNKTVSFSNGAEFANFTEVPLDGTNQLSQTSGTGVDGNPGRVQLTVDNPSVGGNDSVLYYTPAALSGGLIQLPVGETATVSFDYLATDATSAWTPRIGFHNNTTDATPGSTGDSIFALPRGAASKTLTVRNYVGSTVIDNNDSGAQDMALVNNNWYRTQVAVTKTASAGDFDVDVNLYSLDSSGNISALLRNYTDTFTNAPLYSGGFYAYIDLQVTPNGTGGVATPAFFTDAIDNFNLSVTGVIPEPSTALLLGFGMLGLVRYRKRKGA